MAREFDYIREVRSRIPPHPGVIVGPGDDCAVLARPLRNQLATTDLLQDGVDFILADCGPEAAGSKAMLVNLSDIAAMAGVPRSALVGLCVPKSNGSHIAMGVFEGLQRAADEFDVAIVGGDTNSWNGPLVISVTLLGEVTARGPVRRSGAKPGDWLFVTGPLGGSLLGRHLHPRPRIREALALHAAVDLHAMIDISDGLAADAHHLSEESQCGVVLVESHIPVHEDAHRQAKQSGQTPLHHALSDGEDFELAFAVSPEQGRQLLENNPPDVPVFHVGSFVESGFWMEGASGRTEGKPAGWEHSWS